MNFRICRIFFDIPLVIITIILISSCGWLQPETRIYSKTNHYVFNPDTILDLLNHDNMGGFLPREDVYLDENPTISDPVNWDESDYLLVAQSIHKFDWGESLEKWNLARLNYSVNCSLMNSGIQGALFTYMKVDQKNKQESRFVSSISIVPQKNSVSVNKEEFSHPRKEFQSIDLSKLNISVIDAIEIAELNGGNKTRSASNDQCDIQIFLQPTSRNYTGWKVIYYSNDDVLLDYYYIDPQTGKLDEKK